MPGLLEKGFGFGRKVPETVTRSAEDRSFREGRPCITEMIRQAAEPLADLDDPAFAEAFDRFADARVVLIGEASHGTSEFYRARAAITRRLVERHGFSIVALEADWPDAASLNRRVRDEPEPAGAEPAFQRFPAWMWRNTDVDIFIEGLRAWNLDQAPSNRCGVYGLDLYNLSASMQAVIAYLRRVDPAAARLAAERYGCLTPWAARPQSYGRLALSGNYHSCEEGVLKTLLDLQQNKLAYADGDDFLDAAANARLVRNAEAYFRAMYYGAADSWNLRDTHMFETLCALLEAKGPDAKAVVWAHNSHIGDASRTEMGKERGELNIGQLCRERFGDQARLIGLGTHSGTVGCANDWDEPMQVKRLRPGLTGSYEQVVHDAGLPRCLLDLRPGVHEALRQALSTPRLERFIGVIYRPETERWAHYAACDLANQYDAYLWLDETTAVTPTSDARGPGPDETFPTGL